MLLFFNFLMLFKFYYKNYFIGEQIFFSYFNIYSPKTKKYLLNSESLIVFFKNLK